MQLDEIQPNRREYSRIDAYIPLTFRLIPEEEQPLVRSRISGDIMLADFKLMPALEDNPKLEWFNELNEKIDNIIHILTIQYEGFHSLSFKFINISGNGLKFSSQQYFSPGDLLEFKMILTMYKPVALYVYGKVVNVEKQTSGYFISVSFYMMDSTIRDQIVRFTFEMERETLRNRLKED
jgi:hypothetical protein